MPAVPTFEMFIGGIVHRRDHQLFNYGTDEQIARGVEALTHFAKTTPLTPVLGEYIDLAGFGQADVVYASATEKYVLLTQVADALGIPPWKACKWADQEWSWSVRDQRRKDEERGDGRLGYDLLRDHLDLDLCFIQHDVPDAKPDASGQRWEDFGEWLISRDRLPSLILVSPWSREYMDNTMPHMAHMAAKVWPGMGAVLDTAGLTEEEALRRATRGPSIPPSA